MLVIEKGSKYLLENLGDKTQGQQIFFIQRIPKSEFIARYNSYPEAAKAAKELNIKDFDKEAEEGSTREPFITVVDGTTNEELLEVLIHRLSHQNNKAFSKETDGALHYLNIAKMYLISRTYRKNSTKNKELIA